ncbi:hypothetical protein [Actinomadura rubrisoli]|uniref:Uncharacterized protein n=1 Tax=Actinomadura rubrisoli TaxID=2530368 RepID=A0A4V2YWL1_9ACTN|nr:hypothetical protein [Actinomadura rubrisoli]TDD85867.1 hypothetical protein E1298_18230 [Actinomadura rubrisoli]
MFAAASGATAALARWRLWPLFAGGGRAWDWDWDWDWSEHGTRHESGIQPADVQNLLDRGGTGIVFSYGMELCLKTMPETVKVLEDNGSEVHIEEPQQPSSSTISC